MNSHLSPLLVCLGHKFATNRASEKTLLNSHQLRHPLH